MITVIRTDSGNYNLFGTRDGMFTLQGNITLDELKELKKEVDSAVKTSNLPAWMADDNANHSKKV